MNMTIPTNLGPVRVQANHTVTKQLGNWTTARRFEVHAHRGRAVLDLRSTRIPEGFIEVNVDLAHATPTLLVSDNAAIDDWTLRRPEKGATLMATVVSNMSMSLDGFVAHPTDGVNHLFGWYGDGNVTVPTANPRWTLHTSKASADRLRDTFANVGALISGRRTFDDAGGWGGHHPVGAPVFVVTHNLPKGWPRPDAAITFVTDGLDNAVEQAKAVAGDKLVAINSADLTQQCLNAGLLDEIHVDLIPVLLGEGVRSFDHLAATPVELADPEVVEGTGVTHLRYRVNRSQ